MDLYGPFYNPAKILSYGRNLMFSVGSRSIGKTTGWCIDTVMDFLKSGKQWIYVRRTKDELDVTAPTYFDNATDILMAHNVKMPGPVVYKGGEYMIGDKVAGFAIPLSLQQKYKSSNFSGVHRIIYDEFMITPGSGSRYIGGKGAMSGEVDAMTSLYQTVDRGVGRAFRDETQIVFLGNAGSFFNPFFIEYGIDRLLRPDTKYLAPKEAIYVVECTRETAATKLIEQSIGYKMSTKKSRDYAYENKYADLGDSAFIQKPKGRRVPLCNLVYEGDTYGVYSYTGLGFLYMCHEAADGRVTLALTTADHKPNYLLISRWHGHPITNELKQMYDLGSIRFADHKCKMALDFYLKYDMI